MKYYKRLGVFKTSSGKCRFDPHTMHATSYGWYTIVDQIGGRVYVNADGYSMQTRKHIELVCRILDDLGVEYEYQAGLNDLGYYITNLESQIKEFKAAIAAPRTWKSTNVKRQEWIEDNKVQIALAQVLLRQKEQKPRKFFTFGKRLEELSENPKVIKIPGIRYRIKVYRKSGRIVAGCQRSDRGALTHLVNQLQGLVK